MAIEVYRRGVKGQAKVYCGQCYQPIDTSRSRNGYAHDGCRESDHNRGENNSPGRPDQAKAA